MYKNFNILSKEKKERIIQVAIKEFADRGYVAASTNNIVKKSGISKGALFNYFKSKKDLYLYITDYVIECYVVHMKDKMVYSSPDVFHRIIEWLELKLYIYTEDPVLYKFFTSFFMNPADEVKSEIEEKYTSLLEYSNKLIIEGVDLSSFRDDIDKQKAFEVVLVVLTEVMQKYINSCNEFGSYEIEARQLLYNMLKDYIVVLRKGFCKDERSNLQ